MHPTVSRSVAVLLSAPLALLLAQRADAYRIEPLPQPSVMAEPTAPYTAMATDGPAVDGPLFEDDSSFDFGDVWSGRFVNWENVEPNVSANFAWQWQLLPEGLVWRSYLAGVKEPRLSVVTSNSSEFGAVWDSVMGGRVSLLRYGTPNAYRPEGWELQIEAAAMPRIWPNRDSAPLIATDYRVGLPLVWAQGKWQFKTGYYHISSHLGDEYMILEPNYNRINYMRDAWMLAVGYYWTDNLRLFAETDYAFGADGGAEPWEFQFGADWSPAVRGGAPFAAFYGNLREELDYGGFFVVQAGWQWRGGAAMKTFRLGFEYINGQSQQYEFYNWFEQQVGFGIWYDY